MAVHELWDATRPAHAHRCWNCGVAVTANAVEPLVKIFTRLMEAATITALPPDVEQLQIESVEVLAAIGESVVEARPVLLFSLLGELLTHCEVAAVGPERLRDAALGLLLQLSAEPTLLAHVLRAAGAGVLIGALEGGTEQHYAVSLAVLRLLAVEPHMGMTSDDEALLHVAEVALRDRVHQLNVGVAIGAS
eukprot:SAG11_NODE_10088_length_856_cov_1.365918_1_plen_192_part_00